MTSREIVRRTLDFQRPERVARSFREPDMFGVGNSAQTHATEWAKVDHVRWERTDEWGNTWGRIDDTSKGEVTKGVLDSIEAIDRYEFPDYSNAADYQSMRQHRKDYPDMWITGNVPGFTFNIARKMRRLDQYMIDLVIEKERMHILHDRIDKVIEDMISNYAEAGADGIMFPEDWGTQDRTLISPEMWREEFGPRFTKLCGLAHDAGLKVFMHSCGQIEAIVPDLIDAGIDCLQFDQPALHGIDVLAAHQERAKITFWCPVDIQKTLQTRDRSAIAAEAHEMLDKLWKGRGGFIAGYYGDNASIGLDPEWQEIACDAFVERGVAARYPAE